MIRSHLHGKVCVPPTVASRRVIRSHRQRERVCPSLGSPLVVPSASPGSDPSTPAGERVRPSPGFPWGPAGLSHVSSVIVWQGSPIGVPFAWAVLRRFAGLSATPMKSAGTGCAACFSCTPVKENRRVIRSHLYGKGCVRPTCAQTESDSFTPAEGEGVSLPLVSTCASDGLAGE